MATMPTDNETLNKDATPPGIPLMEVGPLLAGGRKEGDYSHLVTIVEPPEDWCAFKR